MNSRAESVELDLRERPVIRLSALLVSESPETIVAVQNALRPFGVKVIACVGPAHGPCYLDEYNTCPFADHAAVAIVDMPPSGSFVHHWREIPAESYAERLARKHPGCFVVLCDRGPSVGLPTGGVARVEGIDAGIAFVRSMATHPARANQRLIPVKRKDSR